MTSARRTHVSVIGDRTLPEGDSRRLLARELGRKLVDEGYVVMCGGLGDLAKCLSEGSRSSPSYAEGRLVALLPGFDPAAANDRFDVVVPTGLDQARNMVVANADAVVALGGGAGTLSEIAFAWTLHRLIIAYSGKGWSGKLAGSRVDDRVRYPDIPDDQVYGASSAEEVAALLRRLLPFYAHRHSRIPG